MLKPTWTALAVGVLLAGLPACSEVTPTEEVGFEFSGSYATAEKFGGAAGIWQALSTLTISDTQDVTYRGNFIMNPTVTEMGVAWSRADGNATNADFVFLTDSSSDYFWSAPVSGRLFQGRIQYAGQGYLDFRGIVE